MYQEHSSKNIFKQENITIICLFGHRRILRFRKNLNRFIHEDREITEHCASRRRDGTAAEKRVGIAEHSALNIPSTVQITTPIDGIARPSGLGLIETLCLEIY